MVAFIFFLRGTVGLVEDGPCLEEQGPVVWILVKKECDLDLGCGMDLFLPRFPTGGTDGMGGNGTAEMSSRSITGMGPSCMNEL